MHEEMLTEHTQKRRQEQAVRQRAFEISLDVLYWENEMILQQQRLFSDTDL
jgi:hypothetical protein